MIISLNLIHLVIFIINITHFVCEKSCDFNKRYNTTSQKCEYVACFSVHDCPLAFDGNRICVNQKCVCSDDFYETTHYGQKVCSRKIISIYKHCDKLGDCGLNQFCVDNTCECQSGYEYYYQTESCEYEPCRNCEKFDSNRLCAYGIFKNGTYVNECKCKWGFIVDPNTLFCNLTDISCINNSDCTQYSDNMVCVDNICQCEPNYKKKR